MVSTCNILLDDCPRINNLHLKRSTILLLAWQLEEGAGGEKILSIGKADDKFYKTDFSWQRAIRYQPILLHPFPRKKIKKQCGNFSFSCIPWSSSVRYH